MLIAPEKCKNLFTYLLTQDNVKTMQLAVLDYISTQNVHFSQLCDREQGGVPLFYPTLYAGQNLWQRRHSTQRDTLTSIQRAYEWAHMEGIDLDQRFANRLPLTTAEIGRLGGFLMINRKSTTQAICPAKFNSRCGHIQHYLEWLAGYLINHANGDIARSISDMIKTLSGLQLPTGSEHQRKRDTLAKHLSVAAQDALCLLFQNPHAHVLRPANRHAATRNAVMLEILYETGMRFGELLSLKLKNFTPARGGDCATLQIDINHDDELDRRVRQPVAKTLGRLVPITEQLSKKIQDYLRLDRALVPYVEFGDEHFIFINHRANATQGKPLEASAFYNALQLIRDKYPALRELHPHLLRHDWNYRFSKSAQELGLNETEEASQRCYLMGWIPGSTMATLYNERHIIEGAAETGLKAASYVTDRRTPRS